MDGTVYDIESVPTLDRYKQHDIDIVVDRIVVKPGVEKRVADSVETALKRSKGLVGVEKVGGEEQLFSENFACTACGISLPEIEPRTFSFNSPFGACETCHGLGTQSEFDPELIAPDREMSIGQGQLSTLSINRARRS